MKNLLLFITFIFAGQFASANCLNVLNHSGDDLPFQVIELEICNLQTELDLVSPIDFNLVTGYQFRNEILKTHSTSLIYDTYNNLNLNDSSKYHITLIIEDYEINGYEKKFNAFINLPENQFIDDLEIVYLQSFFSETLADLYEMHNKNINLTLLDGYSILYDKIKELKNVDSVLPTDIGFEKFNVEKTNFKFQYINNEINLLFLDTLDNYQNLNEALSIASSDNIHSFINNITFSSTIYTNISDYKTINNQDLQQDEIHIDFYCQIPLDISEGEVFTGDLLYKINYNLNYNTAASILDKKYALYHQTADQYELGQVAAKGDSSVNKSSETEADLKKQWRYGSLITKKYIYKINVPEVIQSAEFAKMQFYIVGGFIDGILSSLKIIYDTSEGIYKHAKKGMKWNIDFYVKFYELIAEGCSLNESSSYLKDDIDIVMKEIREKIDGYVNSIKALYEIFKEADFNKVLHCAAETLITQVEDFLQNLIAADPETIFQTGIFIGKTLYDIVGGILTAGGTTVASITTKILGKAGNILKGIEKFIDDVIGDVIEGFYTVASKITKKCIKGFGCFVKNTPVLMASKSKSNIRNTNFGNTAKAMAVAASMPIVAVPIPEVQLLDYAVAHETVNSTYGLTASADDDIYLGLTDKDPYTSDQQRERDEYEINDRDWNEVVFEEVNGSSTAKLALHQDWIKQKGYQVDAIVEMNLPEQGISGPFRITSIKHIIPQKKPTDEDENDDYNYKPVTALFTHESNQVYEIDFDNGESLGVTYQHPIYSTTAGDWKLAGELEIGEEVLSKSGNTKVVSSTKKEGLETVYNLEVKKLHNFLVGESGVVVHNTCHKSSRSWFKEKGIPAGDKNHPIPGSKKTVDVPDKQKIKDKHPDAVDEHGNLKVCYDDLGFPDFRNYVPKLMGKDGQLFDGIVEIASMKGKNSKDFKAALDILKTKLPSDSPIQSITAGKVPFDIDGVKYTFHHHQDGKSMMLVPSTVNNPAAGGVSHIGGGSIMKKTDESPFKDFGPNSGKDVFTKCK